MLVVLPSDLKALFFMDVVMNVDYIKMYKRYLGTITNKHLLQIQVQKYP